MFTQTMCETTVGIFDVMMSQRNSVALVWYHAGFRCSHKRTGRRVRQTGREKPYHHSCKTVRAWTIKYRFLSLFLRMLRIGFVNYTITLTICEQQAARCKIWSGPWGVLKNPIKITITLPYLFQMRKIEWELKWGLSLVTAESSTYVTEQADSLLSIVRNYDHWTLQ